MAKRKKKEIGLQNRLEIVVQSLLDYDEEGGNVSFEVENNQLIVIVPGVVEADGQLLLQPEDNGLDMTTTANGDSHNSDKDADLEPTEDTNPELIKEKVIDAKVT